MKPANFDKSLADAMALFWKAYHEVLPIGADQEDYEEAVRAGIEAILIGTQFKCEHCGEWT